MPRVAMAPGIIAGDHWDVPVNDAEGLGEGEGLGLGLDGAEIVPDGTTAEAEVNSCCGVSVTVEAGTGRAGA